MAKEHPNHVRGEWVDDGRGRYRLNSGRPAQVQGTVERDPQAVRPGQQAQEQYYPDGASQEQSGGGLWGWLTGRR